MGVLSDLPPELITLIVDNLHDDRAALGACALASRVFLPPSQAHLFERIELRGPQIHYIGGDKMDTQGNTSAMQTYISSDPDGVLSYTRSLSILLGRLTEPKHLEGIYDHLMAFKNVRGLQARLFATRFVKRDFARYFSHFQPTLRCLHLKTLLTNPKGLIAFIASFPLLQELSIEMTLADAPSLPNNKSKGLDPDLLSPLRGSLRLSRFRHKNDFATELAKVRVQYHTLSICDAGVWTGIRELITACAPTLRVLNIMREIYVSDMDWGPPTSLLAACTELTEINLPIPIYKFSSNIQSCSTLLSTVSFPHLQKITLTLDKDPSIFDNRVMGNLLDHEEWQPLDDALLGVSSRIGNVLEVVIIFPVSRVRSRPDCETLLPRFGEAGKVRFEFLWIGSSVAGVPAQSGMGPTV